MSIETGILITDRLRLRPVALADSAAIQPEFERWQIVRYLSAGMPWPYPADGASRMLRDVTLPSVERHEELAWAITLRSQPATLIGMISLMIDADDNRGYWLGRAWHGLGLMTEACAATTDYWFDVLGRPQLRETKAMVNEASRRLSERQGMRLVRVEERAFVSGRLLAGVWELTATEWRNRRKQATLSATLVA